MDLNEHKKWVYYFKKRNLGVWALNKFSLCKYNENILSCLINIPSKLAKRDIEKFRSAGIIATLIQEFR